MKVRFLDVAEAELADAVPYYDGEASGLGDRLVAELRATVAMIEVNPENRTDHQGIITQTRGKRISVHELLHRCGNRDSNSRLRASAAASRLLVEASLAVSWV